MWEKNTLTGVLVFIIPQSITQITIACIFAFACLMGFELTRPHVNHMDTWLYRLGCIIMFLTNFMALLIKFDSDRDQELFGIMLIMLNVVLTTLVVSST